MSEKVNCTVREGRFVEPCVSLQSVIDGYGYGKKKGVFHMTLTNMKEMKPSRSYVGIKTNNHPNGFLFNVCPFCGERIDAPFNSDEQETTP